jgi:hypothetical protein
MSKKPRIEEYQEPAGGWDRRFGDRPCTARTATALRGEAKRIFLALPRRNKNRRFGGRGLQRARAAPLAIAAEAACQAFRRWAGKESVPLREEFYSADSRTIKPDALPRMGRFFC